MNTTNPAIRNIISDTVSASYTSTLILDTKSIGLVSKYGNNEEELRKDRQFQKMSDQEQAWILTTMGTGAIAVNYFFDMPSQILGAIWEFVSDIVFPGKRLARTKENIVNYINTAKNEYNNYVIKHEQFIYDVQAQIDTINKRKPIMKDYILKKVALKLCKLGINSQLEDYPMESIDMRAFILNKEFNFITKEFDSINNDLYTKVLENMPIIPVFPAYLVTPFLVKQKINELENKFSDIQNKTNLVFEKMKSDNSKIENLSIALNNIAKVYTDVNEKFIPAIEQILDIISVTYKNNINTIPENLLFLLRTSTALLKELAERRIIPQNISKVQIDSVIEASNDISVSYEKLRKEFMKAA